MKRNNVMFLADFTFCAKLALNATSSNMFYEKEE